MIALVTIVTIAGGIVLGLLVVKRVETGSWQMIDRGDLVKVRERLVPPKRGPSRIIYLAREPLEISGGDDDAPRQRSSVVAAKRGPATTVKVPGWKGSTKNWTRTVACVQKLFAPFHVEVTDQRPSGDDYVLVAVGGRPGDVGETNQRVGGLAPFSGQVIPRPVVFVFARQLGHQVTPVCETIGMEVAHAYGLDHAYLCKDVMTYLKPCGAKSFVDKDVPCGERKRRPCADGAATQNSYQRLMQALGPRKPVPAAGPAR
jgi:hypothetical protein